MSTIVYKLRDKETGKFSGGGDAPWFSSHGKEWNTIGGLKCHISRNYTGRNPKVGLVHWVPDGLEIVEISVSKLETKLSSAAELYSEYTKIDK